MALTVIALGVAPAASAAAANPFERGPDPTPASIEAVRGPFAIDQVTLGRFGVRGFGGGTIFYPETTAAGTFGAVAIALASPPRRRASAGSGPASPPRGSSS